MSYSDSLSALSAISISRSVSANNIANMNTDKFKASRVDLETGPEDQGVQVAAVQTDESPGPLHAQQQLIKDDLGRTIQQEAMVEGSNTDLTTEVVNQITDVHAWAANVQALRSQTDLDSYLVNTMV